MGLTAATAAIYLNIIGGKLARRVKTKTATSQSRVNKENRQVEEELYRDVTGRIIRLDKKNHEKYGDTLLIYLEDKGEIYCVQCGFDGQYGTSFLKTLPHVNLKKPVTLNPMEKIENDKPRQTLFIKQDGKTLKRAFTKDTPNGMPEPKKSRKGKWDFSEVIEFLEEEVFEPIKAELSKGVTPVVPENPDPVEITDEKDDLPF